MKRRDWISALVVCAIAAAGMQASFAAVGGAREQAKPILSSSLAGARLFFSATQRERAESEGIVPEGTRSILNVRARLRYGQFVWDATDIGDGALVVRVNLDRQLISVFRGGHEIGTAVILYGAEGHDTPLGRFPIMAKLEKHRSATYDAPMPYTLRLTGDGVAIHGSEVRWGAATHGCIGVPVEFARRLFDEVKVGDTVEVIGGVTDKTLSSADPTLSTIS